MLHQYTTLDVNAQPTLLKKWVIDSAKTKAAEQQNSAKVKSTTSKKNT